MEFAMYLRYWDMIRLSIFLVFLCGSGLLAATELYDSLGRLHIDSSYRITARQLARWNQVELKLQQAIEKDFRYAEIARENEMETKLLLALTVDTGGNIIAVSRVLFVDSSAAPFINNHTFQQAQKIIAYTNLKAELKFRPFPGKYTQTYYLPFYVAVVKEQTSRLFYRGWMYHQIKADEPINKLERVVCHFPSTTNLYRSPSSRNQTAPLVATAVSKNTKQKVNSLIIGFLH